MRKILWICVLAAGATLVQAAAASAQTSVIMRATLTGGEETPNLVLSATDSDVIKAYVELGLGVAIVANMAFDARRDRNLRAIDASHLFDSNTVYLGFRRGSYLRGYALDFIEMAVPHLNRKTLLAAAGGPTVSALAGSPR